MKKAIQDLLKKHKEIVNVKEFSVKKIVVEDWPVLKCQYGCDSFGKNWACPPSGDGPDVLRRSLKDYKKALLVIGKSRTVSDQRRFMKDVLAFEKELFLSNFYKVFALMPGPCALCKKCTRPKPCVRPHEMRPEMAGMGVNLFETLRKMRISMKVLTKPQEFKTYAIILLE